jgi:hypothetical protein
MSYSLEIHFISKSKKIDIKSLSEFDLDSLRDCVYDFIPETSKLCMYSSETFGKVSNLTKEQYNLYNYLIKSIQPVNQLWTSPVIVVLKKSNKFVEVWKNIFKSKYVSKPKPKPKPKPKSNSNTKVFKRKYCCSNCNVNGHNKNNKCHK